MDREFEVLTAVASGSRSKEITLKLGVDSRAAAVSVAIQRGIIT